MQSSKTVAVGSIHLCFAKRNVGRKGVAEAGSPEIEVGVRSYVLLPYGGIDRDGTLFPFKHSKGESERNPERRDQSKRELAFFPSQFSQKQEPCLLPKSE